MNQGMHEFDDTQTLRDYLQIVRRRKYHFLLPSLLVGLLAVLVAFGLPARYKSQATILIEDQEVPREFVVSTITTFAAQQVQIISQRVLTTERISSIAKKYGLFSDPETGKFLPVGEMAEEFRAAMEVEMVSADVIDPTSGRAQQATIAFKLGFEDENPALAQRVTNELVTLYLDENLRTRTERAASTEEFLGAESAALDAELKEIEARMAEFKAANEGALPELFQYNLSTLEQTRRDMERFEQRAKELTQRKLELTAQLSQLSPWLEGNGPARSPDPDSPEYLASLRLEYRQKSAVYKETHPEVARLAAKIAELEKTLGVSGDTSTDTVGQDVPLTVTNADNPAYILVDTQLKSVIAEQEALAVQRTNLLARQQSLEAVIARSPAVEQEFRALLRDYETAQLKYREIRIKQRTADLAENLESERKGERFILIEPPSLPTLPSSPNRPALLTVGMALALGAGLLVVLIFEGLDNGIHGVKRLTQLTGAPPFAVIGYIETSDDRGQRNRFRRRFAYVLAVGLVATIIGFHLFVRPIDLVWYMLLQRIGI